MAAVVDPQEQGLPEYRFEQRKASCPACGELAADLVMRIESNLGVETTEPYRLVYCPNVACPTRDA